MLDKEMLLGHSETMDVEDFDQTDLASFPRIYCSNSYHNVVVYGVALFLEQVLYLNY